MKHILTTLLICFTACSYAQTSFTPDSAKFAVYLKERSNNLELKLYKMALAGELKAYKTDSLASFYTPVQVADRGFSYEVIPLPMTDGGEFYDSVIPHPFIPDSSLTGLGFHTVITKPSPENILKTLRAVSVTFTPSLEKMNLPKEPVFVCDWEELKLKLPADDILFLSHLYSVKALEPMQFNSFDNWQLNYEPLFWNRSACMNICMHFMRNSDYRTISQLLYYAFNDNLQTVINADNKIFINKSTQAYESKSAIEHENTYRETIRIPTEYEGKFKDTILVSNIDLRTAKYYLSGNDSVLNELVYDITAYRKKAKSMSTVSYALSWAQVQKLHPNPWMVWFIEDYYRHQLKN